MNTGNDRKTTFPIRVALKIEIIAKSLISLINA